MPRYPSEIASERVIGEIIRHSVISKALLDKDSEIDHVLVSELCLDRFHSPSEINDSFSHKIFPERVADGFYHSVLTLISEGVLYINDDFYQANISALAREFNGDMASLILEKRENLSRSELLGYC